MKALTVKIAADTKGFNAGIKGAQGNMEHFSKTAKRTIGGMFAGGVVLAGIRKITDELDRAGKLAQRFGTSAVIIQKMGTVAELNGTNFEKVADAIKDSTIRAEEAAMGNKTAAEALKVMGINAREFIGLDLDEKLKALSDGYIKAEESGRGFSTAQVIMGGSADALIPLLKQGSAAITDQAAAASAASDSTVDSVQRINDQWTMAKNKALGFGITTIETLSKTLPIFVRVKDAIQSTITLALETGIAMVKGLLKAFEALKNWDGSAFNDAFSGIGMDIGAAVEKRLDAVGANNEKMFEAMNTADLKRRLETIDKVEKRDEARLKKKEATEARIEAGIQLANTEATAKADSKAPAKFSAIKAARGQAISSLASHGGGRGFKGAMSGLTKVALESQKHLAVIAANTGRPQQTVLG
jgi:hypothetical protein